MILESSESGCSFRKRMGVEKYGSFEQKGLKTLKQAWNPYHLTVRRYFLYLKGGTIHSSSSAVQDDELIGVTRGGKVYLVSFYFP